MATDNLNNSSKHSAASAGDSAHFHHWTQEQISSYVSEETKNRLVKLPSNVEAIGRAGKSFAKDVGILASTDSKTIGNSLINSAQLRQRIKKLRASLDDDMALLRQKSSRYIYAAERIRNLVQSADTFGLKHPRIAWLLKHAIRNQ